MSKFARVCIFLLIYPDEDCVFFTIFALDGMRLMAYGQPSYVRTHFGTVFANLYLQVAQNEATNRRNSDK